MNLYLSTIAKKCYTIYYYLYGHIFVWNVYKNIVKNIYKRVRNAYSKFVIMFMLCNQVKVKKYMYVDLFALKCLLGMSTK